MSCLEDCGRVLNPMLVDEQIRGAIVQGIGGALFEECLCDERGLMLNASMADYLVPMSAEMPDIEVAHVQTPTASSRLGAKGAEAGTAGAPAAVMNAINDALAPFQAHVFSQPITPEKILQGPAQSALTARAGQPPARSSYGVIPRKSTSAPFRSWMSSADASAAMLSSSDLPRLEYRRSAHSRQRCARSNRKRTTS